MRKPSELKQYIDNKIKEYSYEHLKAEDNSDERVIYGALLKQLFDIQKICEKRKKY
jgi:hypothetical protein